MNFSGQRYQVDSIAEEDGNLGLILVMPVKSTATLLSLSYMLILI